MKKILVKLGDQLVSLPGIRGLFLNWTRNRIPIFLLHRAANDEYGIHGYQIDEVMGFVAALETRGIKIVSLEEVIRLAETGTVPEIPVVAFTADDGYADQATVLGNAFAERGLSLTVFLITDFIDGKIWTWDAKVAHAFAETDQSSADIDVGNLKFHFDLSSPKRKTAARREYQLICKSLQSANLDGAIASLFSNLNVALPESPPAQFAPMTWEQARDLEQRGIDFGPHSCTHRVMSRLNVDELEWELRQSWERIAAELSNPLQVIAWPIGQNEDFGARELRIAESLGYQTAVTARHQLTVVNGKSESLLLDRLGFSLGDGGRASWQVITGVRRLNPMFPKDKKRRLTDKNALAGVNPCARPRFRKRTRAQAIISSTAALVSFNRRPPKTVLRDIRRLIFVCQGNICRSPYAAGMAQQLGIPASSCGLEANNIASADEIGARIAFGRGIDLSGHTSANINSVEIGPGDLLLGMQPAHLKALRHIEQHTGAIVSLLGLWSSPARPWIEDPFSLAPSAFENVFRQIEDAIEGLLANMPHLGDGSTHV